MWYVEPRGLVSDAQGQLEEDLWELSSVIGRNQPKWFDGPGPTQIFQRQAIDEVLC